MDISKYALKNKALVITSLIVLTIGGYLAYTKMSKLEDPELKVKVAVVVGIYPGASAHQVELEMAEPLEKAIRSMNNIGSLESLSRNDMCLLNIELESTVPDSECEQNWDMLRRKVRDIQSSLPKGSIVQVLDDYGDVYGMFYAITSDGLEYKDLDKYASLVKREVQNIEGISKVILYGTRNECINVEMVHDKMANLGVLPAEILLTLNKQNETLYSGYYQSGDKRIRVEIGDAFESIDDIRNLVIKGHENDLLKLKDVANIEKGYEQPMRNSLHFDGKEAVGILISAESGTDITKLGKLVDGKIADLQSTVIPVGVNFDHIFFQPDIVIDSMNTFLINLAESILIVIVILMLVMGFKSGVIIAVSLVVIVFGSFLVLDMFDGTLQRVSLGSFILAMGMLVDNAIVIVDGILVDLKRGVPKEEALTNIGRKTAMPLLGATVIAILAFLPIMLSPDMTGTYVRDLFIVLAVSLMLSWILALTHVPIHAAYSLKAVKQSENNENVFDSKPYQRLRKSLDFFIKNKWWTIAAAVVITLISAYGFKFIPQMFFPDMAYDQLYVEYKLPEGTTSTKVDQDLVEIEKYFNKDENVKHITRSIGGTPGRYCLVRAIAEPSMNYGELIIQFKDKKKMTKSIGKYQQELSNQYPDAYLRLKQYNLMYRPYPIEAVFKGPDPAVLKDLAAKAEKIMEDSPATYLVTNNWSPKQPSIFVDYDQTLARNIGVGRTDVALSMLTATDGLPSAQYMDGDRRLNVYVKTTDTNGEQMGTIRNIPIWTMLPNLSSIANMETIKGVATGALSERDLLSSVIGSTPLNQVTKDISIKWEEPIVRRINGQRAIKVQCNNTPEYTAAQARNAIIEDIEAIELPDGYSLSWLGEYDASKQSTKYLFANVPLAIVIMFLIMIALFKDIKKPLIIVCCLPLIAVGVVVGFQLTGKDFGFVAIVGCLGIVGMMIKNGIVLIDEINRQLEEGIEPYKALVESTLSRFRPVMMASLTTVVGMIPLLSDPLFGSLAVTIISGLTLGTLITLLFLPALYAVFFKIKYINYSGEEK